MRVTRSFARELRRLAKHCLRLAQADLFLLSPPKCGRTWLRVMLTHHWHQRFGTPASELIAFDNLHRLEARIPRLFLSHLLNEPEPLRRWLGPALIGRRPVVLLVRDPRDALVSLYVHFRFRSRPQRWQRFGLRDDPRAMSLVQFLHHPRLGLRSFLALYARLADFLDRCPRCLLLRYEDMRCHPEHSLARLLAFLGEPVQQEAIARTLAFAAADNMRRLEAEGFFRTEVLRPRDPAEPRSFKTREGRIGSWQEEVPEALQAELTAMLEAQLDPRFGYGVSSRPRAKANPPDAAGSARSS